MRVGRACVRAAGRLGDWGDSFTLSVCLSVGLQKAVWSGKALTLTDPRLFSPFSSRAPRPPSLAVCLSVCSVDSLEKGLKQLGVPVLVQQLFDAQQELQKQLQLQQQQQLQPQSQTGSSSSSAEAGAGGGEDNQVKAAKLQNKQRNADQQQALMQMRCVRHET